MRPRTKSIVSSSEYFRAESAYATCTADADADADDDDWIAIAMRGSSAKTTAPLHYCLHHPHGQPQPQHGYSAVGLPLVTKGRKRGGSNESNCSSRSTVPSWDENDPDFDIDDDEEDEEEEDEDDDGIARRRRCSHDRRISFDDDVAIVTIPSRDSFDADYKRRVWYSMEDLSRMRELV